MSEENQINLGEKIECNNSSTVTGCDTGRVIAKFSHVSEAEHFCECANADYEHVNLSEKPISWGNNQSTCDDGGSAFPLSICNENNFSQDGMTLRDYFAAKAMQAKLSGLSFLEDNYTYSKEDLAIEAYDVADAMLKAR
jgi:hypothetical protein